MTNYRQSMNQTLDLMYLMREAKILERELTDKELKRREEIAKDLPCLLYTSPSPRDVEESRMPSSA